MSLSSATESQVLNQTNWAAIGKHGRWEIIGFKTVIDNGDTFTLSGLLRGLKGTGHNTNSHALADTFVMLDLSIIPTDTGDLGRYNPGSGNIDIASGYIVTSLLDGTQGAPTFEFINTAVGLKPYAPADIRGSRDGSNNLTITWKRSGRLDNGWDDYQDVPLGEDSEAYEIDCYDTDDSSFGTVVRTIEITSETASYTAAEQTSDGLTPGDFIDVKIYQISATVDRGYTREATI
jgi:hypothetical protein